MKSKIHTVDLKYYTATLTLDPERGSVAALALRVAWGHSISSMLLDMCTIKLIHDLKIYPVRKSE